MSKGYADYLCVMAREIDREFQRESDGVEVPLFCDKFKEWLNTEVSQDSLVNYIRWLHKADIWICESNRDFWTLLKKAWDTSYFQKADMLCIEYEKQMLTEKANAEKVGKEEYGESGKEIGNWVSAFRKYVEFLGELKKEETADSRALATAIENSLKTANRLFLAHGFILWGKSNGKSDSTMDSYVSCIKSVNKKIFCAQGRNRLHEDLPGYVKARNEVKINEMFSEMDMVLTEYIDTYNEEEMSRVDLMNARSALRKYTEFIKSFV